jgi:hypothetical protein
LIRLRFCEVEWTEWGCQTRFTDGAFVNAVPHYSDHHYYVIAHRLGYGDDVMRYCREHEFAHSFIAERLKGRTSHVLWTLSHKEVQDRGEVVYEEMAAQQLQRWIRAYERPIVSGANWDVLRSEAMALLDAADK